MGAAVEVVSYGVWGIVWGFTEGVLYRISYGVSQKGHKMGKQVPCQHKRLFGCVDLKHHACSDLKAPCLLDLKHHACSDAYPLISLCCSGIT